MIRRLLALWPDRSALVRVIVLAGATGVAEGLLYSLLVPVLDAVVRENPRPGDAAPWFVAGGVLTVAHWVLTVVATPAAFTASHALTRRLRLRIGDHLAELPMGWFTAVHKARTARDVAHSAAKVGGFMGQFAPRLVASVAAPLTMVIVLLALDWRIAVLPLAALPLAWAAMRWSGRVVRRTERVLDATEGELTGRVIELGQAQPVLRAAGRARAGGASLQEAMASRQRAYRKALSASIGPRLAYLAVLVGTLAAASACAAWLMLDGALAPGRGVALLVLVVLITDSLSTVNVLYGGVKSLQVALGRVEDVLAVRPLPGPRTQDVHPQGYDIEFDRVDFAYGDRPALRGVSFRCPAGTTTALVGPSGSGKTTVTRLIARFFDVGAGSVRIGGADVRDIPAAELRDGIAVVFQDVYLFDDTIEENVRIARPDATAEELAAAARSARLDEVLDRLPEGWHTQVGEAGAQLSGGERQRVSIARALLKDAPIVLLDEAGSALDPRNETLVRQALAALSAQQGRTVIVIAHRLETLAAADQVVVLEDGGVTQTGSIEDLLTEEGRFAAMWRRSRQARGWTVTAAGGDAVAPRSRGPQ